MAFVYHRAGVKTARVRLRAYAAAGTAEARRSARELLFSGACLPIVGDETCSAGGVGREGLCPCLVAMR